MKKIPTLFERMYENHKVVGITDTVYRGMEWVMDGEGVATIKFDGSCCAIIDGKFYKRYDAKKGKKPPANAIPCCDPDPVTGHWPHWVPVDWESAGDKWFVEAYKKRQEFAKLSEMVQLNDGTYEAIGAHFQGNPYNLNFDVIIPHGQDIVEVPRTFDGIRGWLAENNVEGIVFWKDGKPQCKIKRKDFGFEWPERKDNAQKEVL